MNDLISREEAIDAIIAQRHKAELSDHNFALGLAEDAIRHLPSAEAVQRWIPCSERLPNESGWYVISVVGFENITDVSYFYSDEAKWSDITDKQKVVAWMPLPKPYKGGDSE